MRFIAWEIEEKQFMFSLIESLAYAKEIGIIFFFKTNISIIKKKQKETW